jgi:hypothetical protein
VELPAWIARVIASVVKGAIRSNEEKGYAVDEEVKEAALFLEVAGRNADTGTSERAAEPQSSDSPVVWRTTLEAAAMLGVGDRNVRALCARRSPRREKVGGRWLIDEQSVPERMVRQAGAE